MAKVASNDIMEGLSGKLGKQLVVRPSRMRRTVVIRRPDFSNREFSQGQLNQHNRFKEASAYARVASKTNPIYAKLAAGTPKNAYNLALSDWFHSSVIHQVQRQPGCIRVNATDAVQVTKVLISISDQQGQVLEQGEAKQTQDTWWEYKTTPPLEATIRVEAFDLAGNVTPS